MEKHLTNVAIQVTNRIFLWFRSRDRRSRISVAVCIGGWKELRDGQANTCVWDCTPKNKCLLTAEPGQISNA